MVEREQGGKIANISSFAGEKPFPAGTEYCMSKAAIDMLTKCMALERGKHKVCHSKYQYQKNVLLNNSLLTSYAFRVY